MYGTAKERSQAEYVGVTENSGQDYGLRQTYEQPRQITDSAVDRPKQEPRSPSYEPDAVSMERPKPQLRSQLTSDYLYGSNSTADRPFYEAQEASKQQQLLNSSQQQQQLRTQQIADNQPPSGALDRPLFEDRARQPLRQPLQPTAYNAPPPTERTNPPKTTTIKTPNLKLQTKPNPEYVRPPQNFVLPPQMRPPGVGPPQPQPRPPFAGARPMVGMGPRPPMPPNMAPRPGQMPPPLRSTDSKSNLLMGPPMRPGMPPPQLSQQNLQQARLPNSGGPLSPPGQGPPRPPGGFNWNPPAGAPGMPPGARPPQNMTRPPPPTFARPLPGQPLQAPFRPPFNQQPPMPQQQQQPPQMQQQHMQQQQQPPQLLRPLSAAGSHSNNNDDDDDVIMGPAVTPLKSFNMKADPMGSPLLEETEPPFETSPPAIDSRKGPGFKGDNDSGVDESTQEKDRNGPNSPSSPVKTPTSTSSKPDKSGTSRPPSATPSNKSAPKSRSASKNRLLLKTPEPEPVKKVPMNKVQVGHAPSPNLKAVRSKIGSLDNATYKPGGGHVKIESKKLDIKAAPRIEAKNDKYAPKGGEKKIVTTKLQWNAKSKIGSLENAAHKPGGGDKKIETLKMDFKDKAKSKVGSKDNVKHQPGGGDIKDNNPKDIQTQKLEIKAQSKVGSLDNVKHKPGGGEKKIFDDKDYLKNVEHSVALTTPPTQFAAQGRLIATIHLEFGLCKPDCSPLPSMTASGADENLNQQS
ncbi:basic proline-rich protein isoform X5 [Drosophila ananassae]|uniref:basic proline-rich protein isoform X5 n=1 Tax=Drosophila ananassae TaxID=7217 RepID=UPI001D000907|nr:basic proline-rich protein isoform X5 [Drosophila ananassae]